MAASRAIYRAFSNAAKKFSTPGTIPPSIDWREKWAVTEVMHQGGMCNCCVAIAAVGAVERLLKIRTGKLIPLSAQQIIDNVFECCEGSNAPDALAYIQRHGITIAARYPFVGRCMKPKVLGYGPIFRINGYKELTDDEGAMQEIVAQQPIIAAVNSRKWPIRGWRGKKIYSGRHSDFTDYEVLIIGYGVEDKTPFWLVKNSYGPRFGMVDTLGLNAEKMPLALPAKFGIQPWIK